MEIAASSHHVQLQNQLWLDVLVLIWKKKTGHNKTHENDKKKKINI